MVKRAVGTKACLLGKAVTISYLRKDNFLEVGISFHCMDETSNLLRLSSRLFSFRTSFCS